MTIHINLDDLTQEHVNECAPLLGSRNYFAPCILGTLMPQDARELFAGRGIGSLLRCGDVTIPDGQQSEARAMQRAFDGCYTGRLRELLAKRGLEWPQ